MTESTLAQAYRAAVLRQTQDQVQRARQMSLEMDYYWGRIDAEEVLAALSG